MTTPSLSERLQQKCVDWGAYWRAPDAHGVVLTEDQALELLRDALGVEVEVTYEELPGTILRLHREGHTADHIAAELADRADEMDAQGISISAVIASEPPSCAYDCAEAVAGGPRCERGICVNPA